MAIMTSLCQKASDKAAFALRDLVVVMSYINKTDNKKYSMNYHD